MRPLVELRDRWQVTLKSASSFENLKHLVKPNGQADQQVNPCISGLRSVCWKVFLLFRSTNLPTWASNLADSRNAYAALKEHFLKYIDHPEELGSTLNPLDDDEDSPWNTLRRDEELRAEIFQDVARCMPEEPYFREPRTQRILLDILFILCKLNRDVGYRQGMHELLAPLLWVIEEDAIKEDVAPSDETDKLMTDMLDKRFIEHDAFSLFSLVMQSARSFYELGGQPRDSDSQSNSNEDQGATSPIVERSKCIHEVYLARVDPHLASHITELEVLPQIFLIRWIRLLFGREFPFDKLLTLWDVIFAEDPELELVDLICVAMLLRVRWQLVEANYSMALMLLLKYPILETGNGPYTFVEDALYLKSHLDEIGGANLIEKYSERRPSPYGKPVHSGLLSSERLSASTKIGRRRSPLPSPARFLKQQGGVEALLQGAAKGVFDRGERLGINQAVRDAVGEVKKNMQGLSSPTRPRSSRGSSDVMRWSLDEGRPIASIRKSIVALESRNEQLASRLEDALTDLRGMAPANSDTLTTSTNKINSAMFKIQSVQVYLRDSSLPLLPSVTESDVFETPKAATTESVESSNAQQLPIRAHASDPQLLPTKQPTDLRESLISETGTLSKELDGHKAPESQTPSQDNSPVLSRPQASMPARSTLAQSSFAWMLEQDKPPKLVSKKTDSKVSPFLSPRRPISGVNREKAAFLFGDEPEDTEIKSRRMTSQNNAEEAFDLRNMKEPKLQ